MSKVFVRFPKTGLGNLLLVWARAAVFANLNEIPLITSPWWAFRWGAWIRNEHKKRLYWGYFKESSGFERLGISWYRLKKTVLHEPAVKKLTAAEKAVDRLYVFDQVITDNDLFGAIRDHRDFIKQRIYEMLSTSLAEQLRHFESPAISVHIRRGDFKMGNPITPQSFFIDCINQVRQVVKSDWPVTVFTDAGVDEIAEVLALPATKLSSPKADILDILLMSKSSVIVLSQSSTFSYWSAFLSDALVIRSQNDWQHSIRTPRAGYSYREIKWTNVKEENTRLLEDNLATI